jgi:tellurite resistance protein TerC
MIQVTYLHWTAFAIFLIIMLILDLGIFNRRKHTVSVKEALISSAAWISLAIIFNIGIFHFAGKEKGLEFLTGYILEYSLSVDNIFVFILLFSYFAVPSRYQHKVLFWGIIGAIIMRAVLIALGAALVAKFYWILYLFGIFLVMTGIKMYFSADEKVEPEKNLVVKYFKKYFPVKPGYVGGKFFVKENKKKYATTLFIVLLIIETTDLVFAFDSIPAILSITQDPFIVFTSNAFAILGLRSLYFALANFLDKFHYLKHGLAIVLAFIGIKMLIVELYHFSIGLSLTIVASVIFISIILSLISKKK